MDRESRKWAKIQKKVRKQANISNNEKLVLSYLNPSSQLIQLNCNDDLKKAFEEFGPSMNTIRIFVTRIDGPMVGKSSTLIIRRPKKRQKESEEPELPKKSPTMQKSQGSQAKSSGSDSSQDTPPTPRLILGAEAPLTRNGTSYDSIASAKTNDTNPRPKDGRESDERSERVSVKPCSKNNPLVAREKSFDQMDQVGTALEKMQDLLQNIPRKVDSSQDTTELTSAVTNLSSIMEKFVKSTTVLKDTVDQLNHHQSLYLSQLAFSTTNSQFLMTPNTMIPAMTPSDFSRSPANPPLGSPHIGNGAEAFLGAATPKTRSETYRSHITSPVPPSSWNGQTPAGKKSPSGPPEADSSTSTTSPLFVDKPEETCARNSPPKLQPYAEAAVPEPFEKELTELAKMGYSNRQFNRALLKIHKGNIKEVVTDLCQFEADEPQDDDDDFGASKEEAF